MWGLTLDDFKGVNCVLNLMVFLSVKYKFCYDQEIAHLYL